MANQAPFKQCSMCKQLWQDREIFLGDKNLELNGYSADFEKMENGLFFFTHKVAGCYSTLAIQANKFLDLYNGKKYSESKKGGEECPRFCMERQNLERCPAFCEYAFVREVIQVVLKKNKSCRREPQNQKVENGFYNIKPQ